MQVELTEVGIELLERVEFYSLEYELSYYYADILETKKKIIEKRFLDKELYEIINICSKILMENI